MNGACQRSFQSPQECLPVAHVSLLSRARPAGAPSRAGSGRTVLVECHPSRPLVASADEDGFVAVYDISRTTPLVTSIDIEMWAESARATIARMIDLETQGMVPVAGASRSPGAPGLPDFRVDSATGVIEQLAVALEGTAPPVRVGPLEETLDARRLASRRSLAALRRDLGASVSDFVSRRVRAGLVRAMTWVDLASGDAPHSIALAIATEGGLLLFDPQMSSAQ